MSVLKRLLAALLPLVVFSVLAVFLMRGLKQDPHRVPSALVGQPVPQFSATPLKQKTLLTQDVFRGHVSLLNVFASWCGYCRVEQPVLMDLKARRDIVIYGLNYRDGRLLATQWLKKYGDPYKKIIFDPKGKLGRALGVTGVPETFIIDKQGIIRYQHTGPLGPDLWKKKLLPIIVKLQSAA